MKIAVALSFLFATTVGAQTIEQNMQSGTWAFISITPSAQSFTATGTAALGAGFLFNNVATAFRTANAVISVYSGVPGQGGTLLGAAAGSRSFNPLEVAFLDVTFSSPLALTLGATYVLMIQQDPNAALSTAGLATAASSQDSYAGGIAYIGDSQGGLIAQPRFDLGFRVVQSTTTVPEPSTYVLMALGMVGIGFAVRRNRNA